MNIKYVSNSKAVIAYSCRFVATAILTVSLCAVSRWLPAQGWEPLTPNPITDTNINLYDVFFINSQTGWIVGDQGTILKTVDGGESWTDVLSFRGTYVALSFIDHQTGWTLNTRYQEVLQTKDGGETWTSLAQLGGALLSDIYFVDSLTGWLVGGYAEGVIWKTTDAGRHWTEQAPGIDRPLKEVYFVNNTTGWSIGDGGIILNTQDGGQTWIKQTSTTSNPLESIHFTDAEHGWAVGEQGTILRYDNNKVTGTEREKPAALPFSLYPNPAGQDLYVKWSALQNKPTEVTVYNLVGQKLLHTKLSAGQKSPLQIDLSDLPSGRYVLKVQTQTKSMAQPFMKE